MAHELERLPLSREDLKYLAGAIRKISEGISADKAFELIADARAKPATFSELNIKIYNRRNELVSAGKSNNSAYTQIAHELNDPANTYFKSEGCEKENKARKPLGPKAIEAKCRAIDQSLATS